MKKNKVEVKIRGKEYNLVGAESEEYLKKISAYVDKKICDLMNMNSRLDVTSASILTAINVANDYFKSLELINNKAQNSPELTKELEALKEEYRKIVLRHTIAEKENNSLKLEIANLSEEVNDLRNTLECVTAPN